MAELGSALQTALFAVAWPGLLITSAYAIWSSVRFYRSVRRSAPGLLVLMTVVGWVLSLIGIAFVASFYLASDPEKAAPVILPVFVLWAGSMTVIVWVMHRWGREAVTLESYYLELEHMDRLKDQFINNVAHELNTPITPLRMQLDMLRRERHGPLNDRQKSSLGLVERNVGRLQVLVDQVLLASMVQSGRLRLEIKTVPAKELSEAAVKRAQSVTGSEQSPVRVDVAEDLMLRGDPERLEYVVTHMVAQALRDTQGKGAVEVSAEQRPADVVLRVRDEGAAQGDVERALKPFTDEYDPWTSERGLGLELFISRGLVEMHGGRMWLEVGPDEVTYLACSFPVG